jgi:hypothetical protein
VSTKRNVYKQTAAKKNMFPQNLPAEKFLVNKQLLEDTAILNHNKIVFYKHKELGKQLNELIKQEIDTNNYQHLSKPNYRRGIKTIKNEYQLLNIKCRFSMMPRTKFIRGNGRKVNVGSNEIILALHGELKDEEDISKGFTLDDKMGGRFIIGPSFNNDMIRYQIKSASQYINQIENGEYEQFVKEVLQTMNQTVEKYKQLRVYEFTNQTKLIHQT